MRIPHCRPGEPIFAALLVILCIAVVVWIRLLPLSLPAAEILAENILEQPAAGSNASAEIADARAKLAAEIKSDLSFVAADGRRYAHLGDYDSYVWLRNARNYLRRGSTCDTVAAGECRDAYGIAPLGHRMIYNRSLHIAAIVLVHRVATWFNPGYPLQASAFLVPVIMGALGVLPAFFIGRRLGGNTGGIVAALVISLGSFFLLRSAGSDNDVWNVVMPLYIAWPMIAALEARENSPAVKSAVLAALATGLYAAVWRGWIFTYLIVLCAAAGCLATAILRASARGGLWRAWNHKEVRAKALSLVAYSLMAAILAFLVNLMVEGGRRGGNFAGQGWPIVYRSISELAKARPADLTDWMGGLIFFSCGWLGLLSIVLPRGNLKLRHGVIVAWILALVIVRYGLFVSAEWPKALSVFLFAAPLVVELFVRARKGESGEGEAAVWLVLVWFFAGLYEIFAGVRFLLLFAAPFGFAVAAFADRLRLRLMSFIVGAGLPSWLSPAAGCLVALLILSQPLHRGYATMESYSPPINNAWWKTLEEIKKQSPADAIVNTWWDYGYWVKYIAERRVSIDGGTLGTHVAHWLAKALIASSDAESRGILRMLNCGSEATPLPEMRSGALGKLKAIGLDDYRAYGILIELVKLERSAADRYLAEHGFNPSRRAAVLESTHCQPPESFLVLSKEMIIKGSRWMELGSWDVRRAYLAQRTRLLPETAAVRDLMQKGYTAGDAKLLYNRVTGLKDDEIQGFISPPQLLIPTGWIACREAGAAMNCRITITNEGRSGFIDLFYDREAPAQAKLRDQGRTGAPAALLVAHDRNLEEFLDPSAAFPDVGVLLDVPGRRILIGSPLLIRSTLIRLFYLGDRYSRVFKNFDRRSTRLGEEVASFKIDWGE